jgi:hypothetical protein
MTSGKPFNVLNQIDREREIQYNKSMMSNSGSPEPDRDDFLEIYEVCQDFIRSKERHDQIQDVPYVGDDGFPDAFDHSKWNFSTKQYDTKSNEYTIARSRRALKIVNNSRLKSRACEMANA